MITITGIVKKDRTIYACGKYIRGDKRERDKLSTNKERLVSSDRQ